MINYDLETQLTSVNSYFVWEIILETGDKN